MTKNKYWWVRLTALLLLLLLVVPLHAQDSTTRDPAAMAQRWLGWSGGPDVPPPLPVYEAGATTQFWVTKAGHATPTQITATLAATTAFIDVWVEDGLPFKPGSLDCHVAAAWRQATAVDAHWRDPAHRDDAAASDRHGTLL